MTTFIFDVFLCVCLCLCQCVCVSVCVSVCNSLCTFPIFSYSHGAFRSSNSDVCFETIFLNFVIQDPYFFSSIVDILVSMVLVYSLELNFIFS